jgi:xylan 1,4-beta-xylosidase
MVITNPILPGFHPDPSILRVGEDYYIANSTFEWFPGVEIHHSRNLADWEFVTRPLSTREHLDMAGNPPSGGIWAPCLSYSDGLFWLIFTDVKSWNDGPFKDSHNYVTTASDIRGPWSAPVYLNSSGFDASLFHDSDGRKWYVNMEWDYRKTGSAAFSGILLQEFDPATRTLVGPVTKIFRGSPIGLVEGPHLYRKDGWYYLVVAEGGTGIDHAVTVCRSRSLTGPYELHPSNPLVSSRGRPELPLQKAGHGSWCDTPDGRWFLTFLVGRPLPGRPDCVLGRETALAELTWSDGWPRLKSGGNHPTLGVTLEPQLAPRQGPASPTTEYRFANEDFRRDFMTLRTPGAPGTYSLTERPGWLRIRGKESPVSRHQQALLARRQTDFCFTAETVVDFTPTSFQHMAGLLYRYDETSQYYLRLTHDPERRTRTLGLMVFDQGKFSLPLGSDEVDVGTGEVRLRLVVRFASARFSWTRGNQPWRSVGPELDAGKLSDDFGGLGFTGAFVGMACQDLERGVHPADFSLFTYTADR